LANACASAALWTAHGDSGQPAKLSSDFGSEDISMRYAMTRFTDAMGESTPVSIDRFRGICWL
jgi:hypothetical protein